MTGRPVTCKIATEKTYASSKSDCQGGPKFLATEEEFGTVDPSESETWSFHEEEETEKHVDRAPHGCSILDRKKIYEREPADPMDDMDVNMAMWSILQNTTLQGSSSSWSGLQGEFTIREEPLVE